VARLCAEAVELRVGAVCLSPSMLPLPSHAAGDFEVCTVIGFPSGAHRLDSKRCEAEVAVGDGADELDMVLDLGAVKSGEWTSVEAEIAAVVAVAGGALVKVIIESAALSDDEIVSCCRAAESAGADFVKTSTGFHPAGGATERAVALMRATVGDRLGVKASGGIRTTAAALAMVGAGATRLGTSASAAILGGLERHNMSR
jgi:deoxyribose-phosphate aldolase